MRSRATSPFLRGLVLAAALAPACLVCGCGDDSRTTGTLASRPPGAEEAKKKSIDNMKSIMKSLPKPGR